MKSLRETKTSENLLKAFAGESQARNRYTYYADKAREEGYQHIADIFIETADNEKEHARRFFSFLCKEYKGEALSLAASYPIGLGTTLENLGYAAAGEHEEWSLLYPSFAKVADEEGFPAIASCFKSITEVEVRHEERYNKLLEDVKNNLVFQKPEEIEWKCSICGLIHKGKEAPKICPACLNKQEYFEVHYS